MNRTVAKVFGIIFIVLSVMVLFVLAVLVFLPTLVDGKSVAEVFTGFFQCSDEELSQKIQLIAAFLVFFFIGFLLLFFSSKRYYKKYNKYNLPPYGHYHIVNHYLIVITFVSAALLFVGPILNAYHVVSKEIAMYLITIPAIVCMVAGILAIIFAFPAPYGLCISAKIDKNGKFVIKTPASPLLTGIRMYNLLLTAIQDGYNIGFDEIEKFERRPVLKIVMTSSKFNRDTLLKNQKNIKEGHFTPWYSHQCTLRFYHQEIYDGVGRTTKTESHLVKDGYYVKNGQYAGDHYKTVNTTTVQHYIKRHFVLHIVGPDGKDLKTIAGRPLAFEDVPEKVYAPK